VLFRVHTVARQQATRLMVTWCHAIGRSKLGSQSL